MAKTINYIAQSSILLFFYAVLGLSMFKLIDYLRKNGFEELTYKRLLLLASPSFLIYLIYNWDVIATAFAVLGIIFYLRRRQLLSGLLLGLSISTKILTAGLATYILAKTLISEDRRGAVMYILGLLLGGVIPFIALYGVFTQGFLEFINHHIKWYCENCVYLPLVGRDIYSPLSRHLFISTTTLFLFLFVTVLLPWKEISLRIELDYLLLAITSLIVLNYVFSPQMLLMITPFALIALGKITLVMFLIADIANAALIISLFYEFHNAGSPWYFGSITQYFALIRNVSLLLIMIYLFFKIAREKVRFIQGGVIEE